MWISVSPARMRVVWLLSLVLAISLAVIGGAPSSAQASPGVGAVFGVVAYSDGGGHVGAGDASVSYFPWSAASGYGPEVHAGTTAADGSYTISGMAPGQYVFHIVDARGGGYEDAYVGANSGSTVFKLDHPDVVDVVANVLSVNVEADLGRLGSVAGHVTFEGGQSAAAGSVHIEAQYERTDMTGWITTGAADTDASGHYAINTILTQVNGVVSIVDYRLVATPTDPSSRYLVDRYQWYTLSSPHDITMQFGSVVSGHVDLGSSGHPAAAGQVTVSLFEFGALAQSATTDASGNYRLTGVRSGDYTAWFDTPGGTHQQQTATVHVAAADVAVPSVVLAPLVSISGRVTEVGGGALAGIQVNAIAYDAQGDYVSTSTASTNASGDYSFTRLAKYKYEVSFHDPTGTVATMEWNQSSPYYVPDYLDGTAGAQFDHIDAALPAAGHIAGHVNGPSAADFAGGNVTVTVEVFDTDSSSWVDTGDDWPVDGAGAYNVGDLPPDRYRLLFTESNPQGTSSVTTPTITIAAGQVIAGNNVSLTPPRLSLPSGSPIGHLDSAAAGPSAISVSGWALDPDTYNSIKVTLYVDGVLQDQLQADRSRPDIAAAYPSYLSAHGFAVNLVNVPPGPHTVCAYGINTGPAAPDSPLGCQAVTIASGIVGRIDSIVAGPGTVTVTGWVLDQSTAAPVTVHLSGDINGPGNPGIDWDVTATANVNRPDLAAAYPGYGAAHGFVIVATHVPAGARFFSIYSGTTFFAPDIARFATGVDQIVTVPPADPFGSLDSVVASGPGLVSIAGWAADSDATSPTTVHVYVDGAFRVGLTANANRPDVGAANPGLGSAHGFNNVLSGIPAGTHTVCVYGINQGAGTGNPQLGCRSIAVGGNPIGSLDGVSATGPGAVTVGGWALDPDTASSIAVHIYVDGAFATGLSTAVPRTDVAAAYPGFGAAHGFSTVLALSGGDHQVCAYGINQLSGSANTVLGCSGVSVPTGAPFGNVDSMTATAGHVSIAGWAIDPDTSAPVTVHVYVDGAFSAGYSAAIGRSDVAVASPGYGPAHGFSMSVAVAAESHTICVYALNQGPPAANPALSCRTVAVSAGG